MDASCGTHGKTIYAEFSTENLKGIDDLRKAVVDECLLFTDFTKIKGITFLINSYYCFCTSVNQGGYDEWGM
jgi:hypothetical protein